MLTDKQKQFIEIWANKDKLGLTAEQVASEVGVSKKTIYNWLKIKEVQDSVNEVAVANLDAVIPKLAQQTERLINSNKPNEFKLGMETFLKIKEHNEAKENLNNKSIELEKFSTGAELILKVFTESMLDGVDDKLGKEVVLKAFAGYVSDNIERNGIRLSIKELNKEVNRILMEHGQL